MTSEQLESAAEAAELIKEEVAAVKDAELIAINWGGERAGQTALAAAGRIRTFAGPMSTLVGFDMRSVDALELYALGFLYAHRIAMEGDAEERALIERAKRVREYLLAVAELRVLEGKADADRVASIRSVSRSYVDLARGLAKLGDMVELGGAGVTEEQLGEAASLSKAIVRMLGERRNGGRADSPKRVRARAFTLLVRHYDQCRRALTYLRWAEDDVDAIAPSLFQRPRRRRSRPGTSAGETTTVTESVTATEGASKDAKLESAS